MQGVVFDQANSAHVAAIVDIWNAACGPDLAITERGAVFNTTPGTGVLLAARLAWLHERPVGFVVTSILQDRPQVARPEQGWIDALAVVPDVQRQGIGSSLLQWAERWLGGQGASNVRLGGGLRPFMPGLPVSLGSEQFFVRRGYRRRSPGERVWDVARNLREYIAPESARLPVGAEVRPAAQGDAAPLLDFLAKEFPGRWHYECEEFLQRGGRISDYLVLLAAQRLQGFCRLCFEDSWWPMDRFFPHRLPKPWGQLGPIGISAAARSQGCGTALVDAGLRRLRRAGVDGCVIDWTQLLAFYAKFEFVPYREYSILVKLGL